MYSAIGLFDPYARRSPDRRAHALSTGQRASRRAPTEALTPLQMEEDREANVVYSSDCQWAALDLRLETNRNLALSVVVKKKKH